MSLNNIDYDSFKLDFSQEAVSFFICCISVSFVL